MGAQIPFRVVYEFKPLPEATFRHMFHDGNRIRKLSEEETKEILTLYKNTLKPKQRKKIKLYSKRNEIKAMQLNTKGAPTQNVWTLRAQNKKKLKLSIKKEPQKKRIKPPQITYKYIKTP